MEPYPHVVVTLIFWEWTRAVVSIGYSPNSLKHQGVPTRWRGRRGAKRLNGEVGRGDGDGGGSRRRRVPARTLHQRG